MNPISLLVIGCGFAALPFVSSFQSAQDPAAAKVNRYIGANACKNCHAGADKGEQYDHWSKTPHAKAWETLASPKAKEVAAKLKIDDPQKSDKCLQCHVTAFGAPAAEIKKGFKPESGVQCESCHGPGEKHFQIRFAESSKGGTPAPMAEGEMIVKRDVAICQKCHNDKSPTYQPFCLKERMEKVEHLLPSKKRSKEELEKLRATCYPECPKCAGEKKGEKKDEKKDAGK